MSTAVTKSEAVNELAAALSKAQSEFGPVKKENVNPFFKSRYADLASVIDAVRKVLGKNGLAYTQLPELEDGHVKIITILMHSSGQWISSELCMPVSKADAQGVGSAITYARRYALQSALGIAAEEDDDGNAAVSTRYEEKHKDIIAKAETQKLPPEPPQDPKLITLAQRKRLYALSQEHGWKDEEVRNLLGRHGFEHSNEITKEAYEEICAELGRKN